MAYVIILNVFLTLLLGICFREMYIKARYKRDVFDQFIKYVNIGFLKYRTYDGSILSANEGLISILELSELNPKDIIGKSLSELIIYSEHEDIVRQKIEKSQEIRNYEYSFKTITGKTKYVLYNARAIKDKQSTGYILEVLFQDITEQKDSCEKMRVARDRCDKLFKSSGNMVCVCSLESMIIKETNPVTKDITGFSPEEMLGKPIENFLHPYNRKKLKDIKQDLLFKGSGEFEAVFVCESGRYKEVLISASLVDMEEERAAIFVIKDVSIIVKGREEQKKRNKELEDFCNAAMEREERIRELNQGMKSLEEELSALREKHEDKR